MAEILADVARTANVPTFTSTTNVTTAQVTYRLVQSARSLSALFRQHFRGADKDFIQQATLAVQAGVGFASLPVNCGEVSAVLWVRSSSNWQLMDSATHEDLEQGQLELLQPWAQGPKPYYQIQGNVLQFLPASSVAETVVVYYTNHLDLSGVGQTDFLSRVDADRWLTLDLVVWILNAQGRHDQAQVFVQEKAMLEANLFSAARTRDPHVTETIRDVRSRRGRNARRDPWSF
jgi:hypothetical protein